MLQISLYQARPVQLICNMFDWNEALETWFNILTFPAREVCNLSSSHQTNNLSWQHTLPSKRNATLGSGAPMTPIWGQRRHRGKKLLAGVVSAISGH